MNPFLDLPKPPTLPHNYASLPSTLPPSSLNLPAAQSNPDLPAYVTSSSGFAAHPATIIAQNESLLQQLRKQVEEAERRVREWESGIAERELAEKRRRAPGWLDSEQHLLQPAKKQDQGSGQETSLMDQPEPENVEQGKREERTARELGDALDRAFGRSEMG